MEERECVNMVRVEICGRERVFEGESNKQGCEFEGLTDLGKWGEGFE